MDLQRRAKRSLSSFWWGRRASLLSVGSSPTSPGSCAAAPEKETLPISAPHPAQLPPVRSSSRVSHLPQSLLINHRRAPQLTAFLFYPTGISVLVVPSFPLPYSSLQEAEHRPLFKVLCCPFIWPPGSQTFLTFYSLLPLIEAGASAARLYSARIYCSSSSGCCRSFPSQTIKNKTRPF